VTAISICQTGTVYDVTYTPGFAHGAETMAWISVLSAALLAGRALSRRPDMPEAQAPVRDLQAIIRFEPILAAALAYGSYVSAALMGGARFPGFLRDHLFDGLAPAAVVSVLIALMPQDKPHAAFPWIRRPFVIVALFFSAGLLVFGLIAAAAVFTSGTDHFYPALLFVALLGGYIFPYVYVIQTASFVRTGLAEAGYDKRKRRLAWFAWWFAKRPESSRLAGADDLEQLDQNREGNVGAQNTETASD
jgi:hypothetical protein